MQYRLRGHSYSAGRYEFWINRDDGLVAPDIYVTLSSSGVWQCFHCPLPTHHAELHPPCEHIMFANAQYTVILQVQQERQAMERERRERRDREVMSTLDRYLDDEDDFKDQDDGISYDRLGTVRTVGGVRTTLDKRRWVYPECIEDPTCNLLDLHAKRKIRLEDE